MFFILPYTSEMFKSIYFIDNFSFRAAQMANKCAQQELPAVISSGHVTLTKSTNTVPTGPSPQQVQIRTRSTTLMPSVLPSFSCSPAVFKSMPFIDHHGFQTTQTTIFQTQQELPAVISPILGTRGGSPCWGFS